LDRQTTGGWARFNRLLCILVAKMVIQRDLLLILKKFAKSAKKTVTNSR
jgi:hypothetical protein